jgi:hypothetical protein
MATQYDYTLKSLDERLVMKHLIPIIYNQDKYDIEYYFTDEYGKDTYDCYVMGFEKETHTILKRQIIEIKIRDTHYPDLLLEKDKLTRLKQKAKESDATIIYITTTPLGTYLFNLTLLDKSSSFHWSKEEHWKTTTDKSNGKKMKWVTYLSVDEAKLIDLKTSDIPRYRIEETKSKDLQKTIVKQKRNICIFRDVQKMNEQ